MKNIFLLITSILLLSCSSSEENIEQASSKWTLEQKNNNNELTYKEINFIIEDRLSKRVKTYYNIDERIDLISNEEFIYNGNQLVQIKYSSEYPDGNTGQSYTDFIYEQEKLVEFVSYSRNSSSRIKYTLEYINDEIIRTRFTSSDNGNSYETNPYFKKYRLRFDSSENLTHSSELTFQGDVQTYFYDYNKLTTVRTENNHINFNYTAYENPISKMYINTFGKRNYCLFESPTSFFITKNLSPLIINQITHSQGFVNMSTEHIFDNGKIKQLIIQRGDDKDYLTFEY